MPSNADAAGAAETIAAIATAPGQGGIGIIRLAGPRALAIARELSGCEPRPRHAHHVSFRGADGEPVDSGLLLSFPAPHSFTGDDVVEFQIHGGPVVLAQLLSECLQHGARHARPGEFSERAFHNGKLDLAQAEAIADLIAAGTQAAARAAQRSLSGDFSRRCRDLTDELIALRTWIEAAIDFTDEDIDFLDDAALRERFARFTEQLRQTLDMARRGRPYTTGLTVVIVGAPNAGKSSLLNYWAQHEAAIVTDIPGTTRDVLRETLSLNGIPATVIDTAGLRDTDDPVEQEGVRRARAALDHADCVILMDAPDAPPPPVEVGDRRLLRVSNKCDLTGESPGVAPSDPDRFAICARSGAGVDELTAAIAGTDHVEQTFSARPRHVDALDRAQRGIERAAALFEQGQGELLAEELRLAQQAVGEITGEFSSDDLLGAIFSRFCIGK